MRERFGFADVSILRRLVAAFQEDDILVAALDKKLLLLIEEKRIDISERPNV